MVLILLVEAIYRHEGFFSGGRSLHLLLDKLKGKVRLSCPSPFKASVVAIVYLMLLLLE